MSERKTNSKSNAWLPLVATAGLGIAAFLLARRMGATGKKLGEGVNDLVDSCARSLANLESRIQSSDHSAVA